MPEPHDLASLHAALLGLVEAVAARLPDVPRLAILDAVESEWDRLGASVEPCVIPLVVPATVWRLRHVSPLAA